MLATAQARPPPVRPGASAGAAVARADPLACMRCAGRAPRAAAAARSRDWRARCRRERAARAATVCGRGANRRRGAAARLEDGVQVVIGAEAGDGGIEAAVAVERQLALVERGQLLAARVVARAVALGGHGRLVVRRRGAVVPERVLAGACARAARSPRRPRPALLGAAQQAARRQAAGRAGCRRRRAAGAAEPAPPIRPARGSTQRAGGQPGADERARGRPRAAPRRNRHSMGAGPRPDASALVISATPRACSPMHWYMCARSATSRARPAPGRLGSASARANAASASAGRASCAPRGTT